MVDPIRSSLDVYRDAFLRLIGPSKLYVVPNVGSCVTVYPDCSLAKLFDDLYIIYCYTVYTMVT